MADYFSTLLFWHWWVLGLVLVVVEMVAPGFLLLVPSLSWQVQFLIFGVLAIGSVAAGRYYLRRNPIETDDATLNRRGAQYIGRVVTPEEPIVNGLGKVKTGDSWWRVQGPDLPA